MVCVAGEDEGRAGLAKVEAEEDAREGRGRANAITGEPPARAAQEAGGGAGRDPETAEGAAGGQSGAQADAGAAQRDLKHAALC